MTLKNQILDFQNQLKSMAPAEVLQKFSTDAQELSARDFKNNSLREGDKLPTFKLKNASGQEITSEDLLSRGSLVVTFYRGAWCPYCNLQLKAYQQILSEIKSCGANLVAISPQTPDNAMSMKEKNELEYEVLTDAGNALAKQFGLVFKVNSKLVDLYKQFGNDLAKFNADNSWELPVPATFIIDKNGIIKRAYIEGDYTQRLEPSEIIKALKTI